MSIFGKKEPSYAELASVFQSKSVRGLIDAIEKLEAGFSKGAALEGDLAALQTKHDTLKKTVAITEAETAATVEACRQKTEAADRDIKAARECAVEEIRVIREAGEREVKALHDDLKAKKAALTTQIEETNALRVEVAERVQDEERVLKAAALAEMDKLKAQKADLENTISRLREQVRAVKADLERVA